MARQKGDLANFNLNLCSGSKTKIQDGIVATVRVQTVMTLFLSTGYFTFTWLTTAIHV